MNANPFTSGHQYLVEKAASTYQYFLSEEAAPVIQTIQKEDNVIHY